LQVHEQLAIHTKHLNQVPVKDCKKNAFSAAVNFQTAAMLAWNETIETPKIYFICYKHIITKFGKGGGIIIHPNALHFLLFGRIKRNNIHNARERMGKDSVFARLAVCYCESFRFHRLKNRGGGAYFMLQPVPEVQI
jgi:hypothetical protein